MALHTPRSRRGGPNGVNGLHAQNACSQRSLKMHACVDRCTVCILGLHFRHARRAFLSGTWLHFYVASCCISLLQLWLHFYVASCCISMLQLWLHFYVASCCISVWQLWNACGCSHCIFCTAFSLAHHSVSFWPHVAFCHCIVLHLSVAPLERMWHFTLQLLYIAPAPELCVC